MPPRGSLYSYTVVRLGETPRALGYVDLPNGLRVLADISPLDRLAMDVAVELMPAVESPDAPLCFGVTEE
jgi:uncharacterized OB-fold protein